MPVVNGITKVTIGNVSFSFNALVVNPNKYLPLMQPLFTARAFTQKATETQEKYLHRLFNMLNNRQTSSSATADGVTRTRAPRRRNEPIGEENEKVLNAMGIDVVKTTPVSLSIVFKDSGNKYRMKRDTMLSLVDTFKKSYDWDPAHKVPIKFGVELEFIGNPFKLAEFNAAMYKRVGQDRYNPVMSYHKNDGKQWELGKDCSVNRRAAQPSNFRGFELTSPIFNLNCKKDLNELKAVCKLIRDKFDGVVNNTCGTHVHMSFPVDVAVSDDLIKHFARSYRKSENTLFDKCVPNNRKGNKARYSRTVNERYIWDRYRKLNFCNVKRGTKEMHLEFRQLNGTLDYDTIIAWCKLQQLFINLTLDTWEIDDDAVEDRPVEVQLEEIVVGENFNKATNETLMKMSKMIV